MMVKFGGRLGSVVFVFGAILRHCGVLAYTCHVTGFRQRDHSQSLLGRGPGFGGVQVGGFRRAMSTRLFHEALKVFLVPLIVVFSTMSFAQNPNEYIVEVESEGTYDMGIGSSKEVARQVTVFEAKRKAVELAAKYLSAKGLIEAYDMKKKEVYSLAARETQFQVLEERWEPLAKGTRCLARIRAKVQIPDFIKSNAENRRLEETESEESFRQEMEQIVPAQIDPGKDISKAYRLVRRKEWRMAMIYLDHLERKYRDWGEIYLAKATVYYAIHEPLQMRLALQKACHLGNQEACQDLKGLKRVHDTDLDTYKE